MDVAEELKLRDRVLKYIVYKKRTENEIRTKFKAIIDENTLDDIIEYFKDAGYIDDKMYVERSINEIKALKNLSIKEIKYKLYQKGINMSLLDDYIQENYEELQEYEKKSAQNIKMKKQNTMTEDEVKIYLLKKGYKGENI